MLGSTVLGRRGERLSYKAHITHLENQCIELFIGHCQKDAAHNPPLSTLAV